MEKKYYLAYGSNLNIRQMKYRCPESRIVGTTKIPDYQLHFKGSRSGAYLTIEPKEGAFVPVAVWEVTPKDESRLDRYEGYPTFYYKKDLRLPVKGVASKKIRMRDTFVYIMDERRSLGIPSLEYLRVCAEGYQAFGFDRNLLIEAYTESVKESENEGK